ncbi:hypothetical protein [Streptomyces sp. NPDC002133]|uniref:hypothetical protein n=1 Tax=Streptomyces sp. NPDC002133 TaxID=3154409 RepID=UPI00332A9614
MTSTAAQRAWDELNERQQTYLRVLFEQDHVKEEARRRLGARGHWSNTPARVWRRIDFNDPHAPVAERLRAEGVYDSGAGSTLAALRSRGLIETQTAPGFISDPVHVWLTRAGRAAARTGLNVSTRPRPPRGLLSEHLWRQMAALAHAEGGGHRFGRLPGEAHLYLCVGYEQYNKRGYLDWEWDGPVRGRYVFTAAGRAHYREHLEAYRELYPAVDAPELAEEVPS